MCNGAAVTFGMCSAILEPPIGLRVGVKGSYMNENEVATAIYLVGHSSKVKPRLIELQYQRILRYRLALVSRYGFSRVAPAVFLDLRLPSFGMGTVDLGEVPGFRMLLEEVQNHRYGVVLMDLDEVTPGYESRFVRQMLETAGATVLNAYTDDRHAFAGELKNRCGQNARDYEVTDSSDLVNFFPSLASDIVAAALRKELEAPIDSHSKELPRIRDRVEGLRKLRPYAGGSSPFVEDRLSADWQKSKTGNKD